MPVRVARWQELERIDAGGVHLRPVRRTLGISAFGTNAYSGDVGELVVEPHDEADGGHEELYVVVAGAAAFVVDGEAIDAPVGTLVFVHEPGSRREARATADGTVVMAFGGSPGAAGPVSAWEWIFAAAPHAEAGDWQSAYETAARALEDHPDDGNTHYNLASFAARAGRADDALEHLRRATANDPRTGDWAADDADLDAIRDDPRFAAALRGPAAT
jgi:tetratricopeptide (TPR) repeat protein